MNNKINVNDIMKELEKKIRTGLSEKQLDITGISQLIGEHLEKAKEKILKDTSEVISEEVKPCNNETCNDCGKKLKKTKSKTNE